MSEGKNEQAKSIGELRSYLTEIVRQLEQHIKEVHKGYPSTSCHTCIGYRSSIQNYEYIISEMEKKEGVK